MFGKKRSESPSSSKGLWGWGAKTERNESKYDQNNRINMVPGDSPSLERDVVSISNIPSGPIITGQSIEDELAAIEADAKRYEEPREDSQNNSYRIDMAGQLKDTSFEGGAEADDEIKSQSSSSSSVASEGEGMNIASRLEALRAKRNRVTPGKSVRQ